jgi:hypothetical protein
MIIENKPEKKARQTDSPLASVHPEMAISERAQSSVSFQHSTKTLDNRQES